MDKIWRDFQLADAVAKARWDEMVKERARAEAAEAELEVARDLLRAVPETAGASWYADIADYLLGCA